MQQQQQQSPYSYSDDYYGTRGSGAGRYFVNQSRAQQQQQQQQSASTASPKLKQPKQQQSQQPQQPQQRQKQKQDIAGASNGTLMSAAAVTPPTTGLVTSTSASPSSSSSAPFVPPSTPAPHHAFRRIHNSSAGGTASNGTAYNTNTYPDYSDSGTNYPKSNGCGYGGAREGDEEIEGGGLSSTQTDDRCRHLYARQANSLEANSNSNKSGRIRSSSTGGSGSHGRKGLRDLEPDADAMDLYTSSLSSTAAYTANFAQVRRIGQTTGGFGLAAALTASNGVGSPSVQQQQPQAGDGGASRRATVGSLSSTSAGSSRRSRRTSASDAGSSATATATANHQVSGGRAYRSDENGLGGGENGSRSPPPPTSSSPSQQQQSRSSRRRTLPTATVGPLGAYLSDEQTTRYDEFLSTSPPNHRLAQVKVAELLQFWLTSSGVRGKVDQLIRTTLAEAGLTKASLRDSTTSAYSTSCSINNHNGNSSMTAGSSGACYYHSGAQDAAAEAATTLLQLQANGCGDFLVAPAQCASAPSSSTTTTAVTSANMAARPGSSGRRNSDSGVDSGRARQQLQAQQQQQSLQKKLAGLGDEAVDPATGAVAAPAVVKVAWGVTAEVDQEASKSSGNSPSPLRSEKNGSLSETNTTATTTNSADAAESPSTQQQQQQLPPSLPLPSQVSPRRNVLYAEQQQPQQQPCSPVSASSTSPKKRDNEDAEEEGRGKGSGILSPSRSNKAASDVVGASTPPRPTGTHSSSGGGTSPGTLPTAVKPSPLSTLLVDTVGAESYSNDNNNSADKTVAATTSTRSSLRRRGRENRSGSTGHSSRSPRRGEEGKETEKTSTTAAAAAGGGGGGGREGSSPLPVVATQSSPGPASCLPSRSTPTAALRSPPRHPPLLVVKSPDRATAVPSASHSSTATTAAGKGAAVAVLLRSPPRHGSSSDAQSSHQQPSTAVTVSPSLTVSNSITATSRGASYEEIPRFYYPLGRPTTKERVIAGPLTRRLIENPHLRVAEGVTVPGTVLDEHEVDAAGSHGNGSSLMGTSPNSKKKNPEGGKDVIAHDDDSKLSPMSTLRALDDKHVYQYISKEFSKVPAFPRHGSNVSRARLLSTSSVGSAGSSSTTSNVNGAPAAGSRLRSGSSAAGAGSLAKQEASYRNHLNQFMQRICMHAFGIPRYFAFILMKLIQLDVISPSCTNGASSSSNNTSNTMGSGDAMGSAAATASQSLVNALFSTTSNGNVGNAAVPITAHQVKEFYDTHMKGKDSLRRTFDLLILSSRLAAVADGGKGSTDSVKGGVVSDSARRSLINVAGGYFTFQASTPTATPTSGGIGRASLNSLSDQKSGAGSENDGGERLRSYLLPEDFVAYVNMLLQHHPGLTFLKQTPDFQAKYLDTVIYRIFYELDRLDRGMISFPEFASSRLFDALRQVDAADDINAVLLFFSYEHFYVLYCRFWELDGDRDMLLSPQDFSHYQPEDIMNPLIIQRIFAGVGRPIRCSTPGMIGYEDFVWFCLSEEDKSTPRAIRYWFRVLDLDGDGVLSVFELRTFYDATRDKIAQYVVDSVIGFEDVACQVFDMLRCDQYRGLTLADLHAEPEAAAVALNTLTSVIRFLQFEQRDPFVAHQERLLGGQEQSAWDRFARVEYDRMAQEVDE